MAMPAPAYIIYLRHRLTDDQYARLMEIPGAQPWLNNRSAVGCGISGAQCVLDEIAEMGLVASRYVVCDSPLSPIVSTVEQARDVSIANGVYPWVWDSFLCDFQKLAILDLLTRGMRAHLWAEPGAGKTVMAAVAAGALRPRRVLVVTLPGVIRQTADEWRRFLAWRVVEYRPVSRRRVGDLSVEDVDQAAASADPIVLVIGWDHLTENHAALERFVTRYGDETLIVWDEAQEGKNSRRKSFIMGEDNKLRAVDVKSQSATAGALAPLARWRITSTATSIDNSLKDLWGQLTLVEPDAWGITATRFLVRYCGATENAFGGLDVDGMNRTNLEELKYRLQYTVVRIPYDVSHGQLPPKRRQIVRVPIEEQIKDTGFGREINAADKDANNGRSEALIRAANLRLQQAACRKRPATVAAARPYFSVGKGKIIVFSGRRKDCEDLAERFRKEDVDVFLSHGEDSIDDRHEVKNAYMAHPGPCVLIGTWHSWGTGFNLDDTDCIVFSQLPYTPKELAQAEGRGDRISMKRPLMYLYMVAESTIDERIVDILLAKLEQVDAVTPGSRLHAFGGVAHVLKGIDEIDKLTAQMLTRMAADTALENDEFGEY